MSAPTAILFNLLMMSSLLQTSQGDVGTAAQYSPPYLRKLSSTHWYYELMWSSHVYFSNRMITSKVFFSLTLVCIATACYNDSASQFPSNNMFAAAGDGIWDNGAACGRQYLVRCISAAVADSCIADQVIQVKIVDYALNLTNNPPSASGTTIVLSETAFGAIANNSAAPTSINLEFQQ